MIIEMFPFYMEFESFLKISAEIKNEQNLAFDPLTFLMWPVEDHLSRKHVTKRLNKMH